MVHLFCNSVCLVILAFEHILTSSLTHIDLHVVMLFCKTLPLSQWVDG